MTQDDPDPVISLVIGGPPLRVHDTTYADDCNLIAGTRARVQKLLDILALFEDMHDGIQVCVVKTKWMVFHSSTPPITDVELFYRGQPIPRVSEAVYLGTL